MSKVVVFPAPRTVEVREEEERPLAEGEVRLRTLYSGISAGTELTAYRGSNPYLHKRWDRERRLFIETDTAGLQYPIYGWGYEEVGEVIELGGAADGVALGDYVYGTWGHRSRHVVSAEYAASRILPESLAPVQGIFSQIGAIALNGVHDARIRIGETVVVFGLGVPGQIVAQLARHSGARVIGVDLLEKRLEMAQASASIDIAIDAGEGSVAERIRDLTEGRGADVALEASGSTFALHEAVRSVAYSARVVALGFFQGNAEGLFLGEEFHHNRVNIVCSQIYGVDPELTYRWDQARLVRTAVRLQAQGILELLPLITHTYSYEEADEAFRVLDFEPEEALQVVLDFTEADR